MNDGESFAVLHTELLRTSVEGESFAVLGKDVVRRPRYPTDLSVETVVDALHAMVEKGWVFVEDPPSPSEAYWKEARAAYDEWLRRYGPRPDELFSEMGPWFAITEDGRREWEKREEETPEAAVERKK